MRPKKQSLQPNKEATETVEKLHKRFSEKKRTLYLLLIAITLLIIIFYRIVLDFILILGAGVMLILGIAFLIKLGENFEYEVIGLIVGGFIAYLNRPFSIIGQLPLETIITRGGKLEGLNRIYIPVAQESFNYILTGLILGAVFGWIIGKFVKK